MIMLFNQDNAEVSSSLRAFNFWKEVLLHERITVDALIIAFRQQSQQGVVQILEKILEDIKKGRHFCFLLAAGRILYRIRSQFKIILPGFHIN